MVRPRPAWLPGELGNVIDGASVASLSGDWFEDVDPHDGSVICVAARSSLPDVERAVAVVRGAQPSWALTPPVERGAVLHRVANLLEERAQEMAETVCIETAKSPGDALGEVAAAVAVGRFFAGEGQRLYGRTTTSATPWRQAMTIRQPIGVAGLIVPANTPIANVAWKVFPALISGNAVVLKSAEEAPATAVLFAQLCHEAGLPDGLLAVIHGRGAEAGAALVEHPVVGVVSFTGSTAVGRQIAVSAGSRLARVSLELGGRNALVICDDADLDEAVRWSVLSAFSNAGQRCASGSRIIVFERVHAEFIERFLAEVGQLRLGPGDEHDLGPVISERARERVLSVIGKGVDAGARVLTGGVAATAEGLASGFYVEPTVVVDAPAASDLACEELFGPVTAVQAVPDFEAAVAAAAASPYGLTAAIHTCSWDRAMRFALEVPTGVVSVNGGTFGSEPHMPFGGRGLSGNGSREPGTEAIDVYTELKDLYLNVAPTRT